MGRVLAEVDEGYDLIYGTSEEVYESSSVRQLLLRAARMKMIDVGYHFVVVVFL